MLPAQVAEKLPASDVEVEFVTSHLKLLQEPGAGTVIDSGTQLPLKDREGAVSAGGRVLASALGDVGSRISERFSKAQPAAKKTAAVSSEKCLFTVLRRHKGGPYTLVSVRTELCVEH